MTQVLFSLWTNIYCPLPLQANRDARNDASPFIIRKSHPAPPEETDDNQLGGHYYYYYSSHRSVDRDPFSSVSGERSAPNHYDQDGGEGGLFPGIKGFLDLAGHLQFGDLLYLS